MTLLLVVDPALNISPLCWHLACDMVDNDSDHDINRDVVINLIIT